MTRMKAPAPTPVTPAAARLLEPKEDALLQHPVLANSRETDQVPPIVHDVLRELGEPLDAATREFFEPRFEADFSGVRVHADAVAAQSAKAIAADAYTAGFDIVFGAGKYERGMQGPLLGHELAHVVQNRAQHSSDEVALKIGATDSRQENEAVQAAEQISEGWRPHDVTPASGRILRRQPMGPPAPTPGEAMTNRADTWLSTDAQVKADVDVLKSALREIKRNKSVGFNETEGVKRIESAATRLGLDAKATQSLKDQWSWLVANRKSSTGADYQKREGQLFANLRSPLQKTGESFLQSQAKYWLKNTPSQVVDVVYAVADADVPADQLYAYAAKEGLIDYVRDEIGLSATQDPTQAQLRGVSTTKSVSGFSYFGLDDYGTELTAKRKPLSGFLPSGFDQSKVTIVPQTNEKGRTVQSATLPNLTMAIQALAAMLKRRRALFKEDAAANGYATPTQDELVYWTYVYFNAGEFGGSAQLTKHKGKRKLGDWITNNEFPNAIKLLQSYQMMRQMKVF